jgi:hypothetical protein
MKRVVCGLCLFGLSVVLSASAGCGPSVKVSQEKAVEQAPAADPTDQTLRDPKGKVRPVARK